jgi:hypothetical protein
MSAGESVRSAACPSGLERARLFAQAPEALQAHAVDCLHCAVALAELHDARAELLGSAPEQAARQAATEIRARSQPARPPRRLRVANAALPALAAAAVIVLLAGARIGRSVSQPRTATAPDTSLAPARAKGSLTMAITCRRGDRLFSVQDGAALQAGDRLRFVYTTAVAGFLTVFSVDDRGALSAFYPADRLSAQPAPAGPQWLPGSIELDDHRGQERIFALWSEHPVDDAAVRAAVARLLGGASGDLRRARHLDLDVEQVTWLAERP